MNPPPEAWIIGERREGDRRAPRLNEPVSVKLFVTVLSGVILAGVLWLSSTAGSSVITAQRFTQDSARRDFRDSMRARDMMDVRSSVARTDTNVRQLCLMLSSRAGACR